MPLITLLLKTVMRSVSISGLKTERRKSRSSLFESGRVVFFGLTLNIFTLGSIISKAISLRISKEFSFSNESRSVASTILFFPFLIKFSNRASSGITSTGTLVLAMTLTVLLPIRIFFKPLAPFVPITIRSGC